MATNDPQRSNNRKLLVVGLILVLLTINGILFYMQHQKNNKVEEQQEVIRVKNTELENQIKVFEALKVDFERQNQELQSMGLANDSLVAQIASVNKDLESLRAFRNRSYSLADQRRFRDRANSLEQQLKQKDEEIAGLEQDNEELFTENTGLKTTQTQLTDTLSTLKTTNRELSDKVTLASRLAAENMQVTIINRRGKEKEDNEEEYRAKRVDKIKISFNIEPNEVAQKENKEIYMRLIEPDGAALYNLATGSGTFDFEGNETFYTAKRDIMFDNSQQNVSFVFSKGAEYKKGQHTVEIYSGGYKIGQTSFTLK